MTTPEFVHLHTHSHGSLLDGFSKASEYLALAKELKMPGIGITDHGNTFTSYDLVNAARAQDMIGVPGCEFYVAPENPEGARVKKPVYYGLNGQKQGNDDVAGNGAFLHLTVWAYTQEGMHNLFRLSTLSNSPENYYMKPRIDFQMLAEHSEGLIVSTGCPSGEISTRFRLGQDAKAYEYAGRLKDIFDGRVYVEIMEHNMSIDLERKLLPKQLEMAKKLGLPLLATNDAHYAHRHDAVHHEEMLASQSGSRMAELPYEDGGTRFAFNGQEYYLKTAEQMSTIFPEKDFKGALSNTLAIAEMAEGINLDFNPNLMPKAFVPPEFKDSVAYYKHLVNEGLKWRYGNAPEAVKEEARKKSAYEFQVIHSSNFVDYMLTVYEYLNWTREKYSTRSSNGEILALSIGVGRGSVGGSVHAYALGISEIDPIRWDLVFERFMSAGRGATYRVEYDDGTFEDVVVSTEREVVTAGGTEKRYIHQLAIGDEVVAD